MILITGATGTNRKEVVKQLSDRSVRIRVMIRPSGKKTRLPDTGVESVIADFDDVNSLEIALAGVEKAFLLAPSTVAQVTRETNFIRAAKRAQVRHIVKFSILGADPASPSRLMRRHGQTEKVLEDSGIAFTMLRPSYFMQNLLWYVNDIRSQGVFYSSLPATCKHGHVDARDNGAVASSALTEGGHEGKIYRITGPDALSYQEVADILSRTIGKNVRYDSSPEHYASFLQAAGLNVEEVLELDRCVASGAGQGSSVLKTVLEVTKRSSIRFAQFASDYVEAFQGDL